MITCISCMERKFHTGAACDPCSCLCHEPPGVVDYTGPLDVSDDAFRAEARGPRIQPSIGGRDLTDIEARMFARALIGMAGTEDAGEAAVQLAKALLRACDRIDQLTVPADTMATLRAFAASAKAHREFPRTVDAVSDVLTRQDGGS